MLIQLYLHVDMIAAVAISATRISRWFVWGQTETIAKKD